MDRNRLPPLLREITNGEVAWQRLEDIDYESLGYFLSCHLIIEHYLDEYLKTCYPELDWDAARQTFNQKVALLSKIGLPQQFDCIPAIKHMNAIRNKLSHNIEYRIETSNLGPMADYIVSATEGKIVIPANTKELLDQFMSTVCVWFAGVIYARADATKITRK